MSRSLFLLVFIFCIFSISAFSYENQGTTIKQDGCNIVITLQIAIESDSNEASDVAMIQEALAPCWSIVCDLPCSDGSTGKCKVYSVVVVKKWSELSPADRPKFHHINIVSGSGVSYVDDVGVANNGKSLGGKWFRHGYSPRIFCHEVMHLAGLPDHYRDCRAPAIAAGTNNCKDTIKCDSLQKALGLGPPCPGYEDDIMTYVSNEIDCNRNIVEIIRQANNVRITKHLPIFICPDECCEHRTTGKGKEKDSSTFHSGVVIDGSYDYYHMQNKDIVDDKLNLYGFNFAVGGYVTKSITDKLNVISQVKLNYITASGSQSTTQGTGPNATTYDNHYHYHFITLSVGANAEWKLPNGISLMGGPEIGLILGAKAKSNGSTTINNVTTTYSGSFTNVTQKKNIQLGINLGISRQMQMKNGKKIKPFFNIYFPLTNEISFNATKNKLTQFSIGVFYPISR